MPQITPPLQISYHHHWHSFLTCIIQKISQLFIEDSTNLISLSTTSKISHATNHDSSPNITRDTIKICLPLQMFRTVFNKHHEHSHRGIKITYNTFSQYYYLDCFECQRNKHFNMKIQTAPTQTFPEQAPSFNYRISMDTKGPINPP